MLKRPLIIFCGGATVAYFTAAGVQSAAIPPPARVAQSSTPTPTPMPVWIYAPIPVPVTTPAPAPTANTGAGTPAVAVQGVQGYSSNVLYVSNCDPSGSPCMTVTSPGAVAAAGRTVTAVPPAPTFTAVPLTSIGTQVLVFSSGAESIYLMNAGAYAGPPAVGSATSYALQQGTGSSCTGGTSAMMLGFVMTGPSTGRFATLSQDVANAVAPGPMSPAPFFVIPPGDNLCIATTGSGPIDLYGLAWYWQF